MRKERDAGYSSFLLGDEGEMAYRLLFRSFGPPLEPSLWRITYQPTGVGKTKMSKPNSCLTLGPYYSGCGPGSQRSHIPWELVRNVESQASARHTESKSAF